MAAWPSSCRYVVMLVMVMCDGRKKSEEFEEMGNTIQTVFLRTMSVLRERINSNMIYKLKCPQS